MKNGYRLAGMVLLAAMVASVSATEEVQAVSEGTGTEKINFTAQDLSVNSPNVKPGEDTDTPVLTEPNQNPDPLALKIISVSNIDFDTHRIESNDSNKSYRALPFKTKDTEGKDVTSAHFVRFQDVRTDTATNFYTVSATMTKQFSNAAAQTVLEGATLDYKKISLVTGTNNATKPTAAAVSSTKELVLDEKADFVVNKQAGKGFGVFELMFDTDDNAVTDNYEGVSLNIPGTNLLKIGDYQGEITWSITNAI